MQSKLVILVDLCKVSFALINPYVFERNSIEERKMPWLHTPYSKLAFILIMIGLPISFLVGIPWLKQQPDSVVYLLAGTAATGTIVSSFLLAIGEDQKCDEWHRSAARFSNQWGWLAGAGGIAILLSVPQFQDAIVEIAGSLANGVEPDRKIALMAFTAGFMSVVFAQALCTLVLSAGWRYWMSRSE